MLQTGHTLIGLIIAVTTSALIAITLFVSVSNDARFESLKRVNLTISTLHKATQLYYDARCATGNVPSPTIEDLVTEGYLDSINQIVFPANSAISDITIVNGGTPRVQFNYTLTFETPKDAEIVASNQFNAFLNGTSVTWRFSSNANRDNTTTEFSEYLNAFGGTSC